jgi:hypothetical protein
MHHHFACVDDDSFHHHPNSSSKSSLHRNDGADGETSVPAMVLRTDSEYSVLLGVNPGDSSASY